MIHQTVHKIQTFQTFTALFSLFLTISLFSMTFKYHGVLFAVVMTFTASWQVWIMRTMSTWNILNLLYLFVTKFRFCFRFFLVVQYLLLIWTNYKQQLIERNFTPFMITHYLLNQDKTFYIKVLAFSLSLNDITNTEIWG